MKPDARDGLLFLGLIFLGIGVGLVYGIGPALTALGVALILVAVFSAWAAARTPERKPTRPTVRTTE